MWNLVFNFQTFSNLIFYAFLTILQNNFHIIFVILINLLLKFELKMLIKEKIVSIFNILKQQ